MVRNVVLALSSLAVLIVLYIGYTLVTGDAGVETASRSTMDELPPPEPPTTQSITIGPDVQVPGGGKIIFTRFDKHTGRPTDRLMCEDWQPVSSAGTEILVTKPELSMLLPSGMIAIISADTGQLSVERIERKQMRPKLGTLRGHVSIVVDRETSLERTPFRQRPQDLITIAADGLDFDLERGELRTPDRISVQSEEFEIAGTGLDLLWNQASNRVETLTIEQGERFVLYAPISLFGAVTERDLPQPESRPAASQTVARKAPRRPAQPHRATAYNCVLSGGVIAEQYRGDERLGALTADEVQLLFDVGSGAGRILPAAPTSEPASRPARDKSERLVVRWDGRLHLEPAPAAESDLPRRHFIATGTPLILTQGTGQVHCGKVEYHDETQRIWLYPPAGETVTFGLGEKLSATASSVYVDQSERIIKLIGDVELRSRRGAGDTAALSAIRSSYWAELHIARPAATAPASAPAAAGPPPAGEAGLVKLDKLESATFVGDVQVNLGRQKLGAHRLDVTFRPGHGGESFDQLLDTATASGLVTLTDGDGKLNCGELRLAFATAADGELYPRRMEAVGAARIARRKSSIHGDRIEADLTSPPGEHRAGGSAFVLRTLDVRGQAELVDSENKVGARGQKITANFEGENRLTTATVVGASGAGGLVRAEPYTVRAGRIDLDWSAQTLHVDGSSRLSFKTQRSLQGDVRKTPTPVIVTSRQRLHVDGRGNTVQFVGNVLARSGIETLQADTLTLDLEDAAEPARPKVRPTTRWDAFAQQLVGQAFALGGLRTSTSWQELWQQTRALVSSGRKARTTADLFALQSEEGRRPIRKEPVRLSADNAVIASETYEPPDPEPLLHTSISAPSLKVDIVNRQIVTDGPTTRLLLIDRRGTADDERASDAIGVPTALLSRGPNQTAMQCEGRMTYTLGPDGPQRRDTAVFEQGVVFAHRTGKEMVNWAEMLPQIAADPAALAKLKSRNATLESDRLECWFTAEPKSAQQVGSGAPTGAPLRLASLLASGNVYLRDQENTRIREVHAGWLEFSREESRIAVRGTEGVDARVYAEDSATGQFDTVVYRQILINLKDGTIRSGEMVGEMRRK